MEVNPFSSVVTRTMNAIIGTSSPMNVMRCEGFILCVPFFVIRLLFQGLQVLILLRVLVLFREGEKGTSLVSFDSLQST